MIVGVHRLFFVEDVRGWVRARFGVGMAAERTAVFGVSAGGELALAIGLRHPDVYSAIFCASPGGGNKPPGVMPSPLPRVFDGGAAGVGLDGDVSGLAGMREAGLDALAADHDGAA